MFNDKETIKRRLGILGMRKMFNGEVTSMARSLLGKGWNPFDATACKAPEYPKATKALADMLEKADWMPDSDKALYLEDKAMTLAGLGRGMDGSAISRESSSLRDNLSFLDEEATKRIEPLSFGEAYRDFGRMMLVLTFAGDLPDGIADILRRSGFKPDRRMPGAYSRKLTRNAEKALDRIKEMLK